jgi:hypothetical protein
VLNKDFSRKLGASDVAVTASVAATVATLCAGAAYATTIANRPSTTHGLSSEAISRVASTVTTALGDITVTLGATYDANDEITFTMSGGEFGTDATLGFSCASGSGWVAVTSGSNSANRKFRLSSGSVVTDTRCTLAGTSVVDSTVGSTVGNTARLQAQGYKSSTAANFNTGGAAGTVATVVNEWSVAVSTAFDASVDAKKNNKIYTGGAVSDRVLVRVTNADVLNDLAAASSTNALVIDINGDFSFLANGTETVSTTNNTSILAGENSAVSAGAGTATLTAIGSGASVTGLRLTVASGNIPADGASQTYGLDVIGADTATANAITAQNFTATSSYSLAFATGAAETDATLDAGNWGASGAVIFVPYMPIGGSISNVLYFTNNSSSTGNALMTVRGEAGGSTVCTTTATTALKSNGITNLSTDFAALIAACQAAGRIATTDKVFVTISSTVLVANSEVYSGFTVGGTSRVSVVNSSSGYKGNSAGGNIQNVGQGNADNR